MKKLSSLAVLGIAGVLALGACSTNSAAPESVESGGEASNEAADDTTYVIGISQLMEHPSLTAAADGFKAALEESGLNVKFDEQNANGDQSTAASSEVKSSFQISQSGRFQSR